MAHEDSAPLFSHNPESCQIKYCDQESKALKHGRSTEAEARKQKLEAVKHGRRSTEAEVEAKKEWSES